MRQEKAIVAQKKKEVKIARKEEEKDEADYEKKFDVKFMGRVLLYKDNQELLEKGKIERSKRKNEMK